MKFLTRFFKSRQTTRSEIPSEEALRERAQRREQSDTSAGDFLAREALGQIGEEALSHKSESFFLRKDSLGFKYGFSLPDGRRAEGEVEPEISDHLIDLLNKNSRLSLPPFGDLFVTPFREATGLSGYTLRKKLISKAAVLQTAPAKTTVLQVQPAVASSTMTPAAVAPLVTPIVTAAKIDFAATKTTTAPTTLEPVVSAPASDLASGLPGTSEAPNLSTRRSVAIIDDNQMFSRVLERFLSRQGFLVSLFSDAKSALESLNSGVVAVDLVVCDVHMPRIAGIEFIKQLRDCAAHKHTPVIMLTSDETLDTELASLKAGAALVISKNEDPRVLAAHAEKFLGEAAEQTA